MNTKYIDLINQTFYFPQDEFKLENKTLQFHDIDLMISVHDAEQVRTILSEMGELHAPI